MRAPRRRTAPRALLALALLAAGCSPPQAGPGPRGTPAPQGTPPNLLLVTIDTLRADHCSAYGYARPTTPTLARLAAEGVLFEQAYAPIPVTGPSHTSLMTGLYPRATGVVANGHVLGASRPTLAELLRARGYATAAVVSAFPLDRRFGLARGFEHYQDRFLPGESSLPQARWEGQALDQPYDRRADATTRQALAWLGGRPQGRPFFLWVHYFDPHTPYEAPADYRFPAPAEGSAASGDRALAAAYDGEVRFADAELGRLVQELESRHLAEDTLVVVTSDHGEGLGQHGVAEHGSVVYEEATRVPLVFRWKGRLAAGLRWAGPVELLDVLPSVAELLGAGPLAAVQGLSLAPVATGARRAVDAPRPVFLQREWQGRGGELFGVRDRDHKYVERRNAARVLRRELYDLASDPGELRDVAAQQAQRAEQLARLLEAWRTRVARAPRQKVDPESVEGLRALGYVQ